MKRIVLVLLVLMMTATCVLAACESGSEESSTAQQSTAESSMSAEPESSSEESKNESVNDASQESTPDAESKDESKEDESKDESKEESKDESKEESGEESNGDENSDEPSEEDVVPLRVLFSRYTQRPVFVMIGTCTQGADVTAEFNGQKVTVPSYMGWFELSLENSTGSQMIDITFTQTVNGKVRETTTLKAKPTEPQNLGTRAIGSNGAFQFFLEKMVPDYEGHTLFDASALNAMKTRVSQRLDKMHSYNRDAEIIYMIVPSPMTVYPELVPERYTKTTGTTALDQVTQALDEAGATVIDLRETFDKHKNDEMPLYYHLDSHWADYGAYLAYVELFEHISKRYAAAAPRDIDDFTWTADYYTSADACLYLGIPQIQVKEYGYYREFDFEDPSNITSVPRYRGMQLIYNDLTTEEKVFTTNRNNLPSCIVYRDSYCAGIYDILAERMNRTHYIGMWNYSWQNWMIESEKPDYVIYIVAEWNAFEVVYN